MVLDGRELLMADLAEVLGLAVEAAVASVEGLLGGAAVELDQHEAAAGGACAAGPPSPCAGCWAASRRAAEARPRGNDRATGLGVQQCLDRHLVSRRHGRVVDSDFGDT